MGNPVLGASGGPCTACKFYGGQHRAHRPHQPYTLCDSGWGTGTWSDPDNGCKSWQAGAPRLGKRIIVCGGRDFADKERAHAALDAAHARSPIAMIVHGDARGADTLAKWWAKDRGIPRDEFPADWNGPHRFAAGPIRNQAMADAGADGVIAFPGGKGTTGMCAIAEAAGIPVWRPFG